MSMSILDTMETVIINQLENDKIILNLRSNVCVDFTIIFRTSLVSLQAI